MPADLYQAKCEEPGTTAEAHKELPYRLPDSAVLAGLPRQLRVELFPGVEPAQGNPLAAKLCRIAVRGLTGPTVIGARDHQGRLIAVKEVRHSPDVIMPLNLFEAIPYSELKLELRPITAT